MIVNPPLLDGAFQLSATWAFPPVATKLSGLVAGEYGVPVTAFDASELPIPFTARSLME